jgi:hypothetical protein
MCALLIYTLIFLGECKLSIPLEQYVQCGAKIRTNKYFLSILFSFESKWRKMLNRNSIYLYGHYFNWNFSLGMVSRPHSKYSSFPYLSISVLSNYH